MAATVRVAREEILVENRGLSAWGRGKGGEDIGSGVAGRGGERRGGVTEGLDQFGNVVKVPGDEDAFIVE
jgi:hypothetical protein